MTKLLRFTSRRLVREQASLWLVRLEEGLSDEECRQLQEWLEADPTHAATLMLLAEVWDAFDVLAEVAGIFPPQQHGHSGRRFLLKAAGVALAVVTLTVLGGYLLVEHNWRSPEESVAVSFRPLDAQLDGGRPASADAALVTRSYQTAVGEQLPARLPDGSVITLNTDTLLTVEYSPAERLIVLTRGEAIFRVAKEQARPFRVRAGSRVVHAIGTVFNIKLGQDDVEVTVSEGSVRVVDDLHEETVGRRRALSRQLTLEAGELAVIRGASEQVRRMDAEQIEASLAWQHGMLIYRGETLDAVLADVSRYTTVRFSIADESLRNRRVGGYFRAGDVDSLLLALRESFGIEAAREGDVVVLTARN